MKRKTMKRLFHVLLLVVLLCVGIGYREASYAATIPVDNPGNARDIRQELQEAINSADNGDMVVLPAGEFFVDGKVTIRKFVSIKGQGAGSNGTVLYRRETVSDTALEQWQIMLDFQCYSTLPSGITVSGIYFKSKVPSVAPGDGKSQAEDIGIYVKHCADFLIGKNTFANFGTAAIRVVHQDDLARGVIAENTFTHNWRYQTPSAADPDYTTLGYGVTVGGEDKTWISDPHFGSNNFIFIEDNSFSSQRHNIMGHGAGLYVFRHNDLKDSIRQGIDAHGGGAYMNTHSARAYEVYHNSMVNSIFVGYSEDVIINQPAVDPCRRLVDRGMRFRGGEGLVYSNTIQGYSSGIALNVEVPGAYPVPYQTGYQNGDMYIWDNASRTHPLGCSMTPFVNNSPALLHEGRDYHLTAPPSYTAYTYPHPLRSQLGNGEIRINTETAQESALLSPVPASPDQNVSYLLTTIPFMGIKLGQLGEQPFQALAQWLDVIIKTVLPGSGVQPTPTPAISIP